MKPRLSKPQRKALRFAYELMRGGLNSNYLSYVRGSILHISTGSSHQYNRHWIEPDRAPDRPYLSEDVLSALVVEGYMECRPVATEHIWLYRITRDGCAALGVEWLLYPPEIKAKLRDKFLSRRQREQQEHQGLYRQRGGYREHKLAARAHGAHRHYLPYNYRARNRK